MRLVHLIIISNISAWLCACGQPQADAVYMDYLERLARTMKTEVPELASEPVLQFPSRRQLKRIEPEIKMDFMAFLKMQNCNLQQLIAKRNSSLGKVMPSSQRLMYEHRLVQSLKRCLKIGGHESDSVEWMQHLLARKRAVRQTIFWNTVIASPEMAQFFSPSAKYLSMHNIEQRQDILRATSQLLSWQESLGRNKDLDGDSLEQAYLSISNEQYGTRLIKSALLAKVWLTRGTLLITSALDKQPLCPQGRATPQSVIMQNILSNFFVAKIQPHLARIQGELHALSQQFAILEANIVAESAGVQGGFEVPVEYSRYIQRYFGEDEQALPAQYTTAIKGHIQAWQGLLKQCGVMPGVSKNER